MEKYGIHQDWIPVTERLPEVDKDLLVVMKSDRGNKWVTEHHFYIKNINVLPRNSDGIVTCMTEGRIFTLTHWMVRPELP